MPETSLAGLLGARYPHAEVVNVARTGATTAQTLRQFRRVHGDFSVIMLNVGGNDTLWGVPYEAIRKHLRALLRAAKKRAPIIIVTGTGDVGILPFLPILLRWYMSYRTRVVQQIFAEETTAAGTGVIFVELFRTPCDAPFVHAPRDHFAYDLSHPNDAGYAALYGCIAASLSRLGK
jgi:lysophospholipase L1-like esterase